MVFGGALLLLLLLLSALSLSQHRVDSLISMYRGPLSFIDTIVGRCSRTNAWGPPSPGKYRKEFHRVSLQPPCHMTSVEVEVLLLLLLLLLLGRVTRTSQYRDSCGCFFAGNVVSDASASLLAISAAQIGPQLMQHVWDNGWQLLVQRPFLANRSQVTRGFPEICWIIASLSKHEGSGSDGGSISSCASVVGQQLSNNISNIVATTTARRWLVVEQRICDRGAFMFPRVCLYGL